MKFFNYTKPKMLVADEGKQIRDINDVYTAAYVDENGNAVEEHIPHYSTTIFIPDSITEEQARELYIEEEM